MKNIAVLISGNGSNLQSIIDSLEKESIPARICVVVSNRADAYGIVRAQKHGIATECILRKNYKSTYDFNFAILEKLEYYEADYVVLAGYLSILSPDIIRRYQNRIINIHPSLIPAFCGKGFYGLKVHQTVLDYGCKVTGATVHFVDEGTDTGPIILQQPVEVYDTDDAYILSQRVLKVEHQILPKALNYLVEDKLEINGRRVFIKE